MLKAYKGCHLSNIAAGELAKGDQMIRQADRLMAEGISIVARLYNGGLLKRPESYACPFPDLLTFHDAPTVVEQKLFVMFLKHRMSAFQGTFHANPGYALWYGWSKMQEDLGEIRAEAEEVRYRTAERK